MLYTDLKPYLKCHIYFHTISQPGMQAFYLQEKKKLNDKNKPIALGDYLD